MPSSISTVLFQHTIALVEIVAMLRQQPPRRVYYPSLD